MVRYSCDMCGKDMTAANSSRYVLKMESYAAPQSDDITDEDLAADHLEEIGELLSSADDLPEPPAGAALNYDLCPACHARFLANPLNVQHAKFNFSEN